MIGALMDQTVSVERLADVPATNKKTYAPHIANLACHIQPIDEKESQDIQGGFGKNWLMICATTDIIEGDRVTWGTGLYRVTAVANLSFLNEQHTEVTIRIFQD